MTAAGALPPLRHPAFRWLVAGRTISMLGNSVAPIALAFAILDLTGSVTDLGLVVGARSLAAVVFMLAGGVVADRFPRHLVMVAASLLAAATQAMVTATVLTGTATVPLLAALSMVNGMLIAFVFPASFALLPQTVPAGARQQANAINRLGFNSAMIGGAAAGGVLVALVGPGWGLAVDACTFAVAGACFALVRVPDVRHPAASGRRVLADLRAGWAEFASHTWLWVVVVGFMFLNAVYAAALLVLGPAIADGTVGRGAWGLVLASQTTGMVLGAVIAMRLRVRRLLLLGVACMVGQLPLVLALALAPVAWVLLAAALLTGITVEQFAVGWETTMQEHVPADRLARVYSYDALGSLVAVPVGQVAAGPAALAFGTEGVLLVGAVIMVLAIAGMLANPDVRRLERRLPAAAEFSQAGAT